MIVDDKITEIFCAVDEFSKNFDSEIEKKTSLSFRKEASPSQSCHVRQQDFGRCNGVSYMDSTMMPVCHNVRRYINKVFNGFATDDKGTMRWCHGFKLHFVCND